MNRASVEEAVKGLFAHRRPGWPPDPSVLKAWIDHIMAMQGMTEEKVWDGCCVLAELECDFHLGTLCTCIEREASRKAQARMDKDRADEAPDPAVAKSAKPLRFDELVECFSWSDNEDRQGKREKVLDICREEAKRYPQGSAMRTAWVTEGTKLKEFYDERPIGG